MSSEEYMVSGEIIKCQNLEKRYCNRVSIREWIEMGLLRNKGSREAVKTALEDINISIHRGESVGIIGRNGSGKSTLLQMISGVLTPTKGEVVVNGRVGALLELGSGFSPDFTGRENIIINAAIHGLKKNEIRSRIDKIIEFADIGDAIDKPVRTYSSGMILRVAFAVMVNLDVDILIIDEALSVGDAVYAKKCAKAIKDFKKEGTLILVSHDMNAISSVCDRAIWIDSGRIKSDGKVGEQISRYTRFCYEEALRKREIINLKMQTLNRGCVETKITDYSDLVERHWQIGDYGAKGALIIGTEIDGKNSVEPVAVVCGDMVSFRVYVKAISALSNMMVGYLLKDQWDQILWGENSRNQKVGEAIAGEVYVVEFKFVMPLLPGETYIVSVGVSCGDSSDPQVMHYRENAFIIKPILNNEEVYGLVGIPLTEVSARKVKVFESDIEEKLCEGLNFAEKEVEN